MDKEERLLKKLMAIAKFQNRMRIFYTILAIIAAFLIGYDIGKGG